MYHQKLEFVPLPTLTENAIYSYDQHYFHTLFGKVWGITLKFYQLDNPNREAEFEEFFLLERYHKN